MVVASCGLAYELIAAAMASYMLGDSITQFSTIIGAYLFAMGVGSWLSRYVNHALIVRFVQVEVLVGLIGGCSAVLLFVAFAFVPSFQFFLYALVLLTGTLVGLEVPLIMRILRDRIAFRDLVAQVLSFDYVGALVVSIAFPVLLAPRLGLVRTGLVFGIANVVVAFACIRLFRHELRAQSTLMLQAAIALAVLIAALIGAQWLTDFAEQHLYPDPIVHASSTPYQRIVVTRHHDDIRLHLNGNLQFSSKDEYRYHEALVHPGLAALPHAKSVLILGGGDGLAAREVLKYDGVESIQLVDLDPQMTRLFSQSPLLSQLNESSLRAPRLTLTNQDAMKWLEANPRKFDFIVVDFPDPSNFSLGKLYTSAFYRLLSQHLAADGLISVQSTSPLVARRSFWCVVNTLDSVGLTTWPYHAYVPSFGVWGYVLAGRGKYQPPAELTVPTRYLSPTIGAAMFDFPLDMARVPTEINRLNNQVLVRYFEQEWKQVAR